MQIPYSKDDWKNLTDPYDYLHQAQISLLDKEFYFPHKVPDFDPRPFTVPLFYKLCHAYPVWIVPMQRAVFFISIFFMLTAMTQLLQKTSAKLMLIAGVYLVASWWNVLGWANLVLSESLSMSLLFCWLASFIFLYRKKTWPWWLVHVIITILFAFTRDSWPYVLILFYTGICALWLLFKQDNFKNYASLLLLSIGIFMVQQQGAKVGKRSELPVINSIVVRILPNPAFTQWFVEQGMPQAEKLRQNFGSMDVVPEEGQHKLWALYSDTNYRAFLDWVVLKGQPTYTSFLATHPAFVLFQYETPAQLQRIMAHDLFYIDEPRGYTFYLKPVFPLFGLGVATVLCIMLLMIYTQRRSAAILAPVLLALFTLANAILSYNADALEVERHLFTTNILIQLIGFWAVATIWDSLAWRADYGRK